MPRDFRALLQDMLSNSRECQGYAADKTYLAFSNEPRLRRSIERTLQIVGEALTQAVATDPGLLLSTSSAQKIIGLRHHLVHAYHDISEPILWAVVQDYYQFSIRSFATFYLRTAATR